MNKRKTIICGFLIVLILAVAAALRIPKLALRTLHTDEAVHAYKFAELLDHNGYRYDPWEYHGPTLNYFTLLPARLAGQTDSAKVTETTLRLVPVIFGLLLVLATLLLYQELSWPAVLIAAALTAASPIFTYYSRYYIQEMLFVCFGFLMLAAIIKLLLSGNTGYAIVAGLAMGLTHATKETCIITWAAIFTACLFENPRRFIPPKRTSILPIILLFATAAIVSMLFFSSFGSNPHGIFDSVKTYLTYFDRAGHSNGHRNPWWFYWQRLLWFRAGSGPVWTEAFILFFAAIGGLTACNRNWLDKLRISQPAARIILYYTLIITLAYTLIPYKTPWCFLGPWQGFILLAGLGLAHLWHALKSTFSHIFIGLTFLAGLGHLGWQSCQANFSYPDDHANPWVYAHTHPDITKVVDTLNDIASHNPQGSKVTIQAICPDHDYWPLPWYLRRLNVHFSDTIPNDIYQTPIIIASPQFEKTLIQKLYELPPPGEKYMYVPLFHELIWLRPQVELRGYIRKELLDKYRQLKEPPPALPDRITDPAENKIPKKVDAKLQPDSDNYDKLPRFSHESMAAAFEIVVDHPDLKLCEQAAIQAFAKLDELNQYLSRYIPNSDISRICAAPPGQEVVVSPDTLECLQIAKKMYDLTNGVFDITVGGLKDCWFDPDKKLKTPTETELQQARQRYGMQYVKINPENFTVTLEKTGMKLDLGGIGKGFAVDKMADIVSDWGIENALIHGGHSSIRVLGCPAGKKGWLINLRHPVRLDYCLGQFVFTGPAIGSSSNEQGRHIINPRTAHPAQSHFATWVTAPNAAMADALSTGFMILTRAEIEKICQTNPLINAMIIEQDTSAVYSCGDWNAMGQWLNLDPGLKIPANINTSRP